MGSAGGVVGGALITATGWGYRYPGRSDAALSDVSFTIAPGELVVLMGASGSGKSTLLAALAGILPEGGASGTLALRGPGSEATRPARIGFVQQDPESNIVMQRVGDDVAFPLENAAVAVGQIWPAVTRAVAGVGLDLPLDRDTARLSGGQQQLLAVAAATVADPDLLLLDEPTANLDPVAAAAALEAVMGIRRRSGCTVIVVEHRVEAWLGAADRVLLVEGRTVLDLEPIALAGHLAAHPDSAARVWVNRGGRTPRAPARPPGQVVLAASGLGLPGRLAPTDLEVRAGEVVALTGPPGSGKSTLLSCLVGLLAPTSGSVRVGGDAPLRDPWLWPAADIAATFGVVFQNPEHQFVTGRVVDEVRHGLAVAHVPDADAQARAERILDRLHLAHLAGADPFTLSGGEQRRLSVGTALALDPRILVLDEPTFGQDPTTWTELVGIIADLRDAGGSVVLATHDPELVRALGAREIRLAGTASYERDHPGPNHPGPNHPGPNHPGPNHPGPNHPGPNHPGPNHPGPNHPGPDLAAPGGLRALDPVALLGSAMLLSAAALVSGSVALNLALAAGALAAAGIGGLPARRVALLATPALLASASVAFSNALLSSAGVGAASSWVAAGLPASRVLAVALPGLVAAIALDPTALADSLVVRVRVPARAAYSVLAGLRLLPLLADEWAVLGRASRARGLGGSGVPARARQFASMAFRLLVGSLRRGTCLAIALDARGLRPGTARSIARQVRWRWLDTSAILLGVAALAASLSTRI